MNGIPFSRENLPDFTSRTDLHTHYAGALRTETLLSLGKKYNVGYPANDLQNMGIDITKYEQNEEGKINVNDLNEEDLAILEDYIRMPMITQETFPRMERVYSLRKPFTKNKEMLPDLLKELALDYQKEGVTYAELSISNFMEDPDYMKIVEQCLPEIEAETGVKLRFLAAISRHDSTEYNSDQVDRMKVIAKSPYIVGMDVMGHETNSTLEFEEQLRSIARYAMQEDPEFVIRVHAGENPIFMDNVGLALEIIEDEHSKLETETGQKFPMPQVRIGHGIYGISKDNREEVLARARRMRAIIEFNISSNLALNNVDDISQIPIKEYIDAGVRVVLGTDGHGTYSTDLMQEVVLAKAAGLTEEDFKKIEETEKEILENADKREAKHPSIEDIDGLYASIEYDTEDGMPRYNEEVKAKYERQREETLQGLKAKFDEIGAISDDDEIARVTEGKAPIIITGASENAWPDISPIDQAEIALTMQVLVNVLNPDKAYIITGGTNYGVERKMHEAAHRRNERGDNQLVVLGTFTLEAANKKFEGLVKDTITHATILEGEHGPAKDWQQLPDTQLQYVTEKAGHVIAIGGGDIVKGMIQRTHNLGNVDLHLMDGPEGASTIESRCLKGNGYSFINVDGLLAKLYFQDPEMFREDFTLDRIEDYIEFAKGQVPEIELLGNPANFGAGEIGKIDKAVTPQDRKKGMETLKGQVKVRSAKDTKDGIDETHDDIDA